jgi:hypothetical protein
VQGNEDNDGPLLIARKNAAPLNSKSGWTGSYLYAKGDPLASTDMGHRMAVISLLIREPPLQGRTLTQSVRGVSYPPHAAAPKGQNDAFHASWHTTDLNTLTNPDIISPSRAIRPRITYYPACIRKTGALHASLRLSGLFVRCATPRSRLMSSQSHSSQPTPKGEPCATASPATRLGLKPTTHANY